MQPVEARRSERVHYRGSVEVVAGAGAADGAPVRAEALDLGAGGMRISAPVRMPVGAQVTCRVELDGREAALPGRIAWLALGPSSNGMGICFDRLGSYERAVLRHLVERSRAGYRPIELRFAGMQQTIRARARARTNGLRLSAVLPILARGTELSFRLDDEGPLFTGQIAEARLHEENGARRIEVEVEVPDRDAVRFRRHTRYGYADEIEAGEQRVPHTPSTRTDADSPPRGSPAVRAARPNALPVLLATLAGAVSGWLLGAYHAHQPAPGAALAPARAPAQPAAAPAQASAPPSAPPLTPASAPSPGSASAVAPPEPIAPAPLPARADPEVRVEDGVTRVLLPFDGSLERMRSVLWASPYALALTLPDGRVALADGSLRLRGAGITGLRIQRRGAEQLVRLLLSAPIARYSIALENGVLELRVTRAPAADAARPAQR